MANTTHNLDAVASYYGAHGLQRVRNKASLHKVTIRRCVVSPSTSRAVLPIRRTPAGRTNSDFHCASAPVIMGATAAFGVQ
eukprot:9784607-Alexandrium_andersonii.AAC.1